MSKLFVLLLLSNEQHPQISILFLFKVFSAYVTAYVQMMPVSFLSENQKSQMFDQTFCFKINSDSGRGTKTCRNIPSSLSGQLQKNNVKLVPLTNFESVAVLLSTLPYLTTHPYPVKKTFC